MSKRRVQSKSQNESEKVNLKESIYTQRHQDNEHTISSVLCVTVVKMHIWSFESIAPVDSERTKKYQQHTMGLI